MSLLQKLKSIWSHGWPVGQSGDMTWVPKSWDWNFWQEDKRLDACGRNTAVEACVSAISQTIAMMPFEHWRLDDDGGRTKLQGGIQRVLNHPNSYQTQSAFMLNLIRAELLSGNGIAYVTRDNRNAISATHLIPPSHGIPYVDPDTKTIFYSVSGNPLTYTDDGVMIPDRDILHIKTHTPHNPLVGETPLAAAGMAAAAGNSIQGHNAAFFSNMSRGSGALETEMKLGPEEVAELRARWEEQTQGPNAGGTPILTRGLKWSPITVKAADAEMMEAYKMTVLDIARVFRVPPPVIGVLDAATFNNVEMLMKHWLSTGLGYTIRHIEEAMARLFRLPGNEVFLFDTEILLRSDFQGRMDGLSKGVTSGIYSPNEARRREGLRNAPNGDEPRVQQQVVPLSFHYREDPQMPAETDDEEHILAAAEFLRKALH